MRHLAGKTLLLLALLASAALAGLGTSAAELTEGSAMPAFELPAGDGKTYSLDTLRGEGGLVLIVYRGVW